MSDAYAVRRFLDAVGVFRGMEDRLREDWNSVDGKKIDAVVIDLDAAIPGLDGEDLGRALVFKAYAMHWRYLTELGKKNIFEVIDAPMDPRLVEALAAARKGRALLKTPNDIKWADATVQKLVEYEK
jgi:hypothetical protein